MDSDNFDNSKKRIHEQEQEKKTPKMNRTSNKNTIGTNTFAVCVTLKCSQKANKYNRCVWTIVILKSYLEHNCTACTFNTEFVNEKECPVKSR